VRRGITSISRDLERLSVLQDLKNNQIKTSQAAEGMGASLRDVYRLKITLPTRVK